MRDQSEGPLRVVLIEWRPIARKTLRGFATVRIGAMTIPDVTVLTKEGRSWASLPSKAIVSEGRHLVDANGKYRWTPALELTIPARAKFSAAVLQAVLAEFPNALDEVAR